MTALLEAYVNFFHRMMGRIDKYGSIVGLAGLSLLAGGLGSFVGYAAYLAASETIWGALVIGAAAAVPSFFAYVFSVDAADELRKLLTEKHK